MHQRFADLHRASGWAGDPDEFGAAAAILLGDVLLAWSEAMFATSGLDDDALRRARPVCDAMRTEVMAGQYLDVVEQARGGSDRRARASGGAAQGGEVHRRATAASRRRDRRRATPTSSRRSRRYGLPLGEAFQLRDDLLGVFGDPDGDRQAGRR